ncbi:hypothetical protein D0C36_15565 [Mucilaginibacter conchicola]|uniref:Uncharacterized protein n=1 Tax=Mucilaginibacter conchicola TaxID=2303333 RepID=A0A372NUM0_9SPHI|nr:hypothetical protein [Mucilaginibacter conchicola]RFZ92812.1 hypothetical protein D0C36_15565 [Mucilaginibacter conchicola]
MSNSPELINILGIDQRIQKLMYKEVSVPSYLLDYNSVDEHWYPHPPCLVPLFLGQGASYKGVVKHFFCDREVTYVEYSLENGYISEIARNADQFITLMVLKMLITKDELTDEIISFCKQLDYTAYEAADQFVIDHGDDPAEFRHLPYFGKTLPFKYVKELSDYDGDFPSSIHILNTPAIVQNSSKYEIAADEKLKQTDNLPAWLTDGNDKKTLFYAYLANDQFKEAWFSLNSKGWSAEDTAEALTALKNKSDDEGLALVADNWIERWRRKLK